MPNVLKVVYAVTWDATEPATDLYDFDKCSYSVEEAGDLSVENDEGDEIARYNGYHWVKVAVFKETTDRVAILGTDVTE